MRYQNPVYVRYPINSEYLIPKRQDAARRRTIFDETQSNCG